MLNQDPQRIIQTYKQHTNNYSPFFDMKYIQWNTTETLCTGSSQQGMPLYNSNF
jgi:hypothetical protein